MELGISGRKAIVCASSKGLGRACTFALAEARCEIVVNGRDCEQPAHTAKEIRDATGVAVHEVAGDLNDSATRRALIAACPEPDILVNNNGGPPFKAFDAVTRDDILAGVESDMLTPIALVQALLPGMTKRKFGRIVNITSGSVRAPIAGLDISSGARAGLTAFLASAARAHARDNVTINSIQPGTFETDRRRSALERVAAQRGGPTRDGAGTHPQSCPPPRRSCRIRRALRFSGERKGGIHHGPEHSDRRRGVSGDVLRLPRRPPSGPLCPLMPLRASGRGRRHCSGRGDALAGASGAPVPAGA